MPVDIALRAAVARRALLEPFEGRTAMAKRAAHSAPDLPIESGEELPPRKSRVERLLDVIERAGNKVPHPVVIFVMLIGILILLSHIFYLFGATVTFQ